MSFSPSFIVPIAWNNHSLFYSTGCGGDRVLIDDWNVDSVSVAGSSSLHFIFLYMQWLCVDQLTNLITGHDPRKLFGQSRERSRSSGWFYCPPLSNHDAGRAGQLYNFFLSISSCWIWIKCNLNYRIVSVVAEEKQESAVTCLVWSGQRQSRHRESVVEGMVTRCALYSKRRRGQPRQDNGWNLYRSTVTTKSAGCTASNRRQSSWVGRMDRTRMAAFKLLHRHIIVWLVGAQYGELKLNEKV